MNSLKEKLHQLKQELIPLLYISIIQIWWNFNFPAFKRLGSPLNTLVGIGMSIISTIAYISIFIFPEKHAPSFNLEYLNNAPNKSFLKQIHRIALTLFLFCTMFVFWYKDLYQMSNTYYILCYVHWIIVFLLIAHTISRYNQQSNNY